MKKEELQRITYGHQCLNDEQLEEIERAREAASSAEPGDWRVRDGRVVRYGKWTPVVAEAALRFIARCYDWVPQLLLCIRALEGALRLAWIGEKTAHRELAEERRRHEETVARATAGEPGPEEDLVAIAEALELGGAVPRPGMLRYPSGPMSDAERARQIASLRRRLLEDYAKKLGAWARGKQVDGDHLHDPDVDSLRRRKVERDRFDAEERERLAADRRFVMALAEELKLTKKQKAAHVERAKVRSVQGR